MATGEAEKSMELEGSLKVFKFPEVLQFLNRGRMSGVLYVTRRRAEVEIMFREGRIVGATSSVRSVKIGEMLLYAGRITRKALREALETQEHLGRTKFLGEILVERGLIPRDQLQEFIELQVKEEVWELFSWDEGNFRFEAGQVREAGTMAISLEVEPILLEGTRRQDEWQAISNNIPDAHEVYRVHPEFKKNPKPRIEIDYKIWRVLSLINGRLTVEDLVRISNLGKFDTYWALDQLIGAEMIIGGSEISRLKDPDAPLPTVKKAKNTVKNSPAPNTSPGATNEDDKGGKSSLLQIFNRKKAEQETSEHKSAFGVPRVEEAPRDFLTDVALVCDAINKMIDIARDEGQLGSKNEAEALVNAMWREAERRHPKSDLLRLKGNRIDSNLFDRYAHLEGSLNEAVVGCHDDCLQALRLFWAKLLEEAERRSDPKTAERLAQEVVREQSSRRPTFGAPDFSLTSWSKDI